MVTGQWQTVCQKHGLTCNKSAGRLIKHSQWNLQIGNMIATHLGFVACKTHKDVAERRYLRSESEPYMNEFA